MIKNYLIIAIRNILRNRVMTFINVFGLTVSMSVCLLLLLIAMDQFAYDNFHQNTDRIYRVITDRIHDNEYVWSTASTAFPLKEKINSHETVEKATIIKRGLEGVATWESVEMPFTGYYTDSHFLEMFNFPLLKGNKKEVFSLPNSIVLTKDFAKKIFGDEEPLNQTIEVEEIGQFIVTGVLDDFPGKTHFYFEALASSQYLEILEKEDKLFAPLNDWTSIYDNYIYFQVKEGAVVSDLDPLLIKASKENYTEDGKYEYKFKLQEFDGITPGPMMSNIIGHAMPAFIIYAMLGLAAVVLISACFNYANLTTARAVNRAKEIGVRKVVGAKRWHIVGQFMIEAIIIAFISFIFADLMVQFLHPALNNMFTSLGAPMNFEETPNLYLIFLVFALFTGLIAGIVPALFFAATDPLIALKKSVSLGKMSQRFGFMKFNIRKVLVVTQFAFSIFFVITVITIYQQMNMVMTTDHGFKTDGIVNVKLQGVSYDKIKNDISQLANVKMLSATTHMPALGTNHASNVKIDGHDEEMYLSYFGVDEKYIPSLGLEILAGKNFPEIMPEEEKYIVINEKAVKKFGWESPYDAIGKVLTMDEKVLEVIGVVKDFHYERLDNEIGAMGLRYLPQEVNSLIVTIGPDNAQETIAQMESKWKEHTSRPFEYTFYKDDMRLSYGFFEAIISVLGYVTILVVTIACLGLLGMIIFHVQNKVKEIGIRKTLGAEAKDILVTIGKSFIYLILISYLIGGPLAYFVNHAWLESYAYKIDFGVVTLFIGFATVLVLVLITIGSQLFRAMKVNPVDSLKSE